jgi:hypothetical protein
MPGGILWLALLALMIALFGAVARRLSVLIRRTRDLERVQRSVASLDSRLATTVDPLVVRLDEIRRRSGDPAALARDLGAAQATLRDVATEMTALRVPAGVAGPAATMTHEAERAVRAADLVEHGLEALLAARGNRELEAQTALKRGALNLRHARDAFGRAATSVASVRPADLAYRAGARGAAGLPLAGERFTEPGDPDPEGPFEPRM